MAQVEETPSAIIHNTDNYQQMRKITDTKKLVYDLYDTWASTYDEEMSMFGHKKGLAVEEAIRMAEGNRNVRILDVAAGTGICGEMFKHHGFLNVDAIDASEEMLNVARRKGLYKNLYCSFVGKDYVLPIEDNTYDMVTLVGGFTCNHVKADCFEELTRVLKPGGRIFILSCVSAIARLKDEFEEVMKRNDEDGLLLWTDKISVPGYLNGEEGVMYKFQKPADN